MYNRIITPGLGKHLNPSSISLAYIQIENESTIAKTQQYVTAISNFTNDLLSNKQESFSLLNVIVTGDHTCQ